MTNLQLNLNFYRRKMKIFIKDLKKGEKLIKQLFCIEQLQLHKTIKGDPYYRITLQDKTGVISGKIWKDKFDNCQAEELEKGKVIEIDGDVQEYNGIRQIIINKAEITEDYDISLLLESSDKNIDKMFSSFIEKVNSIHNLDLRNLVLALFEDKSFSNKFKRSPAAEMVHHDFVGGLLEHVIEMMELCEPFFTYYPEANRDLVLTGIVFHDIGKIWEFGLKGASVFKTTEGKLVGHITIGIEFLKSKLPGKFPKKTWMLLEHIILSHHTELSFGAVVKPATIEAAIVASVDQASTHVRQFQKAIKLGKTKEGEEFSEYQKWIGTQVYLG